MTPREYCKQIFQAAVAAVHPGELIPQFLELNGNVLRIGKELIPLTASTRVFVIGSGKASAFMAKAVEKIAGSHITGGFIVTKYDHAVKLGSIECLEAAHPVPDQNCVIAVEKTKTLLQKAGQEDIIICLLSGGASALWTDLPGSISLETLQATTDLLLQCGAEIAEINTVRKHLSGIKGGQLLTYAPGSKWFSLIISDVPGDMLTIIASGPTIADTSSFEDAKKIFEKYNLENRLPVAVLQYIRNGINGIIPETVKPGNPVLNKCSNLLIGSNAIALAAGKKEAEKLGFNTQIIDHNLQGDAGAIAKKLFSFYSDYKGRRPACFLTGGETTVTVTGKGKGGRNQHMVLEMLNEMISKEDIRLSFLAAGTDGTDGPTDAAGAFADQQTITNAGKKELALPGFLSEHDAYHFFEKTGDLLKTGSTGTNVMDITVAILS